MLIYQAGYIVYIHFHTLQPAKDHLSDPVKARMCNRVMSPLTFTDTYNVRPPFDMFVGLDSPQ